MMQLIRIYKRDSICIYPNLHGFWYVFRKCWTRGLGETGGRGTGNTRTRCDAIDNNADLSHSVFPRVRKIAQSSPLPSSPSPLSLFLHPGGTVEIDYIDERWNYSPRTKRKETAKSPVGIVKLGGCRLYDNSEQGGREEEGGGRRDDFREYRIRIATRSRAASREI